MTNKIFFQKTITTAKVPTKGTELSAGYDLYLPNNVDIPIGHSVFVDMGIRLITAGIDTPLVALVFPRSGMATKIGLTITNTVPVIDQDYTGNLKLSLKIDANYWDFNKSNSEQVVHLKAGERIAQIVFMPILSNIEFVDLDGFISDVDRSRYDLAMIRSDSRLEGGFGSTDAVEDKTEPVEESSTEEPSTEESVDITDEAAPIFNEAAENLAAEEEVNNDDNDSDGDVGEQGNFV